MCKGNSPLRDVLMNDEIFIKGKDYAPDEILNIIKWRTAKGLLKQYQPATVIRYLDLMSANAANSPKANPKNFTMTFLRIKGKYHVMTDKEKEGLSITTKIHQMQPTTVSNQHSHQITFT